MAAIIPIGHADMICPFGQHPREIFPALIVLDVTQYLVCFLNFNFVRTNVDTFLFAACYAESVKRC